MNLFLRMKLPNLRNIRNSSYFEFQNLVNEERIYTTINNLKNIRIRQALPKNSTDKAAVLIPLCIYNGKMSLLYTLRTSHLSSHRGQVSFPGGKHDVKDDSLEYTAIRETKEELGINPKEIKIWGTGNFLRARQTSVLPVVGQIITPIDFNNLVINQDEVEEVFCVSLEDLCEPSKCRYTQFDDNYSTPVFLGGKRRIWGLTAVITHIFLKSLLPSSIYSHKIKLIRPYLSKSDHEKM